MNRKYRVKTGKHHVMVAGTRVTYEEGSVVTMSEDLARVFGNKFELVPDATEVSAPASISPVQKLGIEDLDEPKKPAPPPVHAPQPEPKAEEPKKADDEEDDGPGGTDPDEDAADRKKRKKEAAREEEKEQKRRRARERRDARKKKE